MFQETTRKACWLITEARFIKPNALRKKHPLGKILVVSHSNFEVGLASRVTFWLVVYDIMALDWWTQGGKGFEVGVEE